MLAYLPDAIYLCNACILLEISRSCRLSERCLGYQIDSEHLRIMNDSRIQDGHHEEWELGYVANIVKGEVSRLGIGTVRDLAPAAPLGTVCSGAI